MTANDASKAYNLFSDEFLGIFNESFPRKNQAIKPKVRKSWLPKELKKCISRKHKRFNEIVNKYS